MRDFPPQCRIRPIGFGLAIVLMMSAIACNSNAIAADAPSARGSVYLVGMGPGDRELVTLKAARVLKEADHVFCFGYLEQEVARFVPSEKITVASPFLMGRFRGQCFDDLPPQYRERARKSVEAASEFLPKVRELVAGGNSVAFAAAGDPTLYCPWSWIVEDLIDLDPTVVPGLSSFNAANAALRQSLTKRGGSVLLSAGNDLGTPDEHGRLTMMLVLFTHSKELEVLLPQLQSRYPADTPIAIVGEAGYRQQQTIFATLGTVFKELESKTIPKLHLLYVGDGLTLPTVTEAVPARP